MGERGADPAVRLGVWAKPTLVGERVTLRPYRADDADAVWEMLSDPVGRELTATTATFDRDQIDAWVASRADAPERLDLSIIDNATGEWAGEAVLNEPRSGPLGTAMSANFRISLRGPAWFGRGLGTEATRLVVAHAFTSIGLTQVTLDVLARNPRAVRAYESAGFVETGRRLEDGEKWMDMELTRDAWTTAQGAA
ncbi:GNAT family N-acetyltransferase [Demequina sp. SO4-18]|uniref:GNAT family N-acetyltransferase n=1 Tax=Demequina sp. SO4-18 TaxID=3401026 RepID=UPI003B5A50A0